MALPVIISERRQWSGKRFAWVFTAAVLVLTAVTAVVAMVWQRDYERDWGAATMRVVTVVRGQQGDGDSCRVTVRVPGSDRTSTAESGPCGLAPGTGVGAWVSPAGRVFFKPPPSPGLQRAHVVTAVVFVTAIAGIGWPALLGLTVWLSQRWRTRRA